MNNQPVLVDPSHDRRILDFRRLGFHDVLVLGRYDYTYAHPQLKSHRHDEMIEICLMEKGRQVYFVEREEYHLRGGDVFITYPGEEHGTGQHPESVGAMYWMIVRIPRPKERFLLLPPAEWSQLLEPLLTQRPRKFRGTCQLKHVLDAIIGVYRDVSSPLRTINLQNLLLRFFIDLTTCASDCTSAERFPSEPIRRVLAFIDDNLESDELQVRTLATIAGLSPSRFKVRFKTEVGAPPAQYLNRCKVERASKLLQHTDLPVTQIALRLGFSTSQYFATVYKRYTGEVPSRTRSLDCTTAPDDESPAAFVRAAVSK